MKNSAVPFDFNVICQVCRRKIKGSEALTDWRGLIVCPQDYETRHPSDLPLRKSVPQQVLPFTSTEVVDVEVTGICTIQGRYGIAGYAVAGCAITGFGDASDITIPSSSFLVVDTNLPIVPDISTTWIVTPIP